MKNWPIARKISFAVISIALVALAVGLEALNTMNSYRAAVKDMEQAAARATLGERINGLVLAVVMDSRGIYMSDSTKAAEKFAQPMLKNLDQLGVELNRWSAMAPPQSRERYDQAVQAGRQFIEFRHELARLGTKVDPVQARLFGDNDANRTNRKALNDRLAVLADENTDAVSSLGGRTEGTYQTSIWTIAAMLVVGLALSWSLVRLVVTRLVVNPLKQLTGSLRELANGNLNADVPRLTRLDEVGTMARAVLVLRDQGLEARALRATQESDRQQAEDAKIEALRSMADRVEDETASAMARVGAQTEQLAGESNVMANAAMAVTDNAESVAAAAEQALANAQSVAGALAQLNASTEEISRQVTIAADEAGQAVESANGAQNTIEDLLLSVDRIDEVTRMIRDIASRTQMLALNATIEAQRAGEAGKGFAVVAEEVKALANQTTHATESITQQIHGIQMGTKGAAQAVASVSDSIRRLGVISQAIAAAMEEQGAATGEISRNVSQTADAAGEVSRRIAEVSQEAAQTTHSANSVRIASGTLSDAMLALRQSVIRTVRTATNDVDRRTLKRQSLEARCEVEAAGGCQSCTLLDICEKGAAVESPTLDVEPGQIVHLKLSNLPRPLPATVAGTEFGRVRLTFDQNMPSLAAE